MTAQADTGASPERPQAGRLAAVFGALVALTIGELLVAGMAAGRAGRITALSGLLMAKIALVLSFFMQARRYRRASVAVFVSIGFAAAAAVVLLLETMYRAGVK